MRVILTMMLVLTGISLAYAAIPPRQLVGYGCEGYPQPVTFPTESDFPECKVIVNGFRLRNDK